MTPSKGLQSTTDPREFRKRHQQYDDDNTFIPPALSAYSIALLNDKTTPSPPVNKQPKLSESDLIPQVTGIYEIDFADKINNNLKSKLSVHFKESSSPPSNSYGDGNHSLNNNNHNNTSLHTSFNLSANNHSTHNTTSDDILDNSLENNSFKSQPTTASNSTSGTSLVRPNSAGIVRSRISRRFRSLGPPKRASEVHDENSFPNNPEHKSPITPPQLSQFSPQVKKTPGTNSKFYRELEKLKANTPDLKIKSEDVVIDQPKSNLNSPSIMPPQLSKPMPPQMSKSNFNSAPLIPSPQPKSDFNLHKFSANHFSVFTDIERKKSPSINNSPLPRMPLHEKPINTLFNDPDNFRKPKPPASIHKSPIIHRAATATPMPVPAIAPSHHSPPASSDDTKKRKAITINGNQYEKLELLGRGGTSKVYKVKSLYNNKLYAIKKVTFDQFDESCIQGFKGEIDLLLKLKHADRVVKLIDYAIGEGSICLVMECGDIDLAHVFQSKINNSTSLDLNFIRYHAIEVFKCVEAVHQADIVHSDLKPANFLFVKGILKIIDFGIANAVPDHTANIYRESQIGTPNYMAPEALTEVNQSLMLPNDSSTNKLQTWKVGKPSDVWSCGCIIYQMIYGRPPYAGYSAQQRIMAIMNPQVKIQYPSKGLGGSKVPASAIELMQKCLERNPNDRWTIQRCLYGDFLHPKIVSEAFVRDLVHLAVNFGHNNRNSIIHDDVYDKLCDTVLKQINELNFA